MTRYIEKNKGTQVNSSNIGVQIHPDVASVKADMTVTLVQVSSTVNIEGSDYPLICTSKRRVYYCSGETATVTIDESDVTYVQFVLYGSLQESGNVDIVWAEGSTFSELPARAYLYTLEYNEDTQEYSNPQHLNNNEKINVTFSLNGYCYIKGYTSAFGSKFPIVNITTQPRSIYEYEEGKTFLVGPNVPEDMTAYGLVTDITEDFEISDIEFTVIPPVPDEELGYLFDVEHYMPSYAEVDTYGWTFCGFIPKHPSVGDSLEIQTPYTNGNFQEDPKETWGGEDITTATITDIEYDENNCTVSYSVNGSDFTEHSTVLTDDNNVICNIPRYMYLKFSQDVEITEE